MGGWGDGSRIVYQQRLEQERADLKAENDERRRKLAQKIVMVLVNKIIHDIIRPGPKPEERECYEMAGELRLMNEEFVDLVSKVLKVDEDESG
jgi:hypothetical protein